MQTAFTSAQLGRDDIRLADSVLRKCVHCGFCTATCPTYVELGNELDSPRGRIMLIKDMLEADTAPSAKVVRHLDRCLTCLSCMSTCPSGVDYNRLVEVGRAHVARTHRRPWGERALRSMLGAVLARPRLLRAVLPAGRVAALLGSMLPRRLRRLGELSATRAGATLGPGRQVFAAEGAPRMRVALLEGCVQSVLGAEHHRATIRLLTRHGAEVVLPAGQGCCGGLSHHLDHGAPARAYMRANVAAWDAERRDHGLDAVVVNASGCGTTVRDYGHHLAGDPRWAEAASELAAMTRDVTEVVAELGLRPVEGVPALKVAYHAACSLQHGQGVRHQPAALLREAGFKVVEPAESHLCCGAAGAYTVLQPDLSRRLGQRKAEALQRQDPDAIAGGNIGCLVQLGRTAATPVVHTVQLLDWASGGPKPPELASY